MSPLVSRWASDEASVKRAIEQDEKVKTVKKGEPLVSKWSSTVSSEKGKPLISKWADSEDEIPEPVQDLSGINKARSSPRKSRQVHRNDKTEETHKVRASTDKTPRQQTNDVRQVKDLLGRLSTPHSRKVEDEKWEDVPEEIQESELEEEIDDRIAPTKGAQDFASRLGISLSVPKSKIRSSPKYHAKPKGDKEVIQSKREHERERIRSQKTLRGTEWDKKKPGTKVDYSLGNPVSDEHADGHFDEKMFNEMLEGKVDWADFED